MSSSDAGVALHCAIHRGTETVLRCATCASPICPRCLVMTPVGAKCPRCARGKLQPAFVLNPLDILLVFVSVIVGGLAMGAIGTVIAGMIRFASIFLPFAIGLGSSAIVRLVVPRKHGTILKAAAALGVVVAFLILGLGDFVVRDPLGLLQSGSALTIFRNVLIGWVINPFNALFLGLGIWVAIYRTD